MSSGKPSNPESLELGKGKGKKQLPTRIDRSVPRCTRCKTPLVSGVDTQKVKTDKFWSSCKRCRDKRKGVKNHHRLQLPQTTHAQQDALPTPQDPPLRAFIDLTTESDDAGMTIGTLRRPDPILGPTASPQSKPVPLRDAHFWRRRYLSRTHQRPLLDRVLLGGRLFSTPRTPSVSGQQCSVCSERLPSEPMRLSGCSHEPDVCQDCFQQYLAGRMETTAWDRIVCPSAGCKTEITHDDVKKFASEEQFTRFDDLAMRSFLSTESNFRYCLAEGCNSGQVHDGDAAQGNIFRCVACGFRACTVHNVAFHEQETCAQYDARVEKEAQSQRAGEDAQSSAYVAKNSVQCPGCTVQIQKTWGCDHMQCTRCQTDFCYICRALYDGVGGIRRVGNTAHLVSCKYHPDRLPAHPDVDEEEEEEDLAA